MVGQALLTTLRARGVSLEVREGQLVTRGPKGAITADLAADIQAQRNLLIELVARQAQVKNIGEKRPKAALTTSPREATCSTCSHWSHDDIPGSWMGLCDQGKQAHGWLDGNPDLPVSIQKFHTCTANWGASYELKFEVR